VGDGETFKNYTERDHEREHDHCDFSREFPHESSFVLKAAKHVEIRRWNIWSSYEKNKIFEDMAFLAYLVPIK
jgi:hypothetical protein